MLHTCMNEWRFTFHYHYQWEERNTHESDRREGEFEDFKRAHAWAFAKRGREESRIGLYVEYEEWLKRDLNALKIHVPMWCKPQN